MHACVHAALPASCAGHEDCQTRHPVCNACLHACMHPGDTELAAHKVVKPGGALAHVMNTGSDKACMPRCCSMQITPQSLAPPRPPAACELHSRRSCSSAARSVPLWKARRGVALPEGLDVLMLSTGGLPLLLARTGAHGGWQARGVPIQVQCHLLQR